MKGTEDAVIKTLLYFDIFSFPLDLEELHRFCPEKTENAEIVSTVKNLCASNFINHQCCFFSVNKNNMEQAFSRVAKYNLSKKKMPTAIRNAYFISRFPFVRGVAISGSLSKYSADKKADIDFFIITAKRRLWLCRSFLHFFKKLTYLSGKQHGFCMNYFLSLDELKLKDKNLYTAIECTTIIPIYQEKVYRQFQLQNAWTMEFLPNQQEWFKNLTPPPHSNQIMKKTIEWLLGGRWGNWCDRLVHKITISWWRMKFRSQGFPMEYFDLDLRSTKGESKYHPFDYQRKILESYQSRVTAFESLK